MQRLSNHAEENKGSKGWPEIDPDQEGKVSYGIYDIPDLKRIIPLGLQHVLTLFGATTLVPILVGSQIGMSTQQQGVFISTVMFAMGIATIIQLYGGSKLPIVQGSSFSFVAPFLAIAGQVSGGVTVAMQYISGSLIGGGLIEIGLGYGQVVKYVKKLFTPQVTAPTIMLIGLSLYQTAMDQANSYWPVAIITVAAILLFTFLSERTKVFAVITGIIVAWIISGLGAYIGVFPDVAAVSFKSVGEASWFVAPTPFRWGVPKFKIGFILAVFAGYVASMIESVGDYHAISTAAGCKDPDEKQLTNGIGAEGLGSTISGILGGVGTTSYTENIGLVGLTGVASRAVVLTGSILLLIMGVIRKIGVAIATIPGPVIGGVYIVMFATIAGVGAQHINRMNMGKTKNYLIVGISLLLGIGVPYIIGNNPVTLQIPWLESTINSVLGTGMAVGAISSLILDNILPKNIN